MLYIEEAAAKFNELPLEIKLEFSDQEVVARLTAIEEERRIPLIGAVMLVAINEIEEEDLPDYLMEQFDVDEKTALDITAELDQKIFWPILQRLALLDANPDKITITLEEEKNMILDIFHFHILSELKHHPVVIHAVNLRIFYILAREENYKNKLLEALAANEEILGKSFVTGGNIVKPTVGNWLKSFVSEFGSGAFDAVALSRFLTAAPNAKNLSEADKDLLSRLLKTYFNLKFFPDSMPDQEEDWQILVLPAAPEEEIPTSEARLLRQPADSARQASADEIKALGELKALAEQYPIGSLERLAVEEEMKNLADQAISDLDKNTDELRTLAEQYPVGSLERMAIDEEISAKG